MSRRAAGLLLCIVAAASCAGPADARLARWRPFAAVHGVVDLSSPRADGRLTLAVNGRLGLLRVGGSVSSFAAGYATATGGEPYIALSAGQRVPGAGCAFRRDDVYALEPASVAPGVVRIDTSGRVRRVATLANGAFPNGVAFDSVGAFGHRLLVTAAIGGGNALYALDCRGRLRTVAASMPRVEGGMAVAPRGFGRFGGQLIAADEILGNLIAVDARGRARILARSGLPGGGDIGVESLGFVPPGFAHRTVALLADRSIPASAHPGTDSIRNAAVGNPKA